MPSTNDPAELLVAGDGRIFVADPDDSPTMPTAYDGSEVDTAPWYEIGYITVDGVTYQDNFTSEVIRAWQAVAAIRVLTTSREPSLTFSAMQWNTQNLVLAFAGGSVSSDGEYDGPLASDAPVERSLVLDGIDGDNVFRFIFPRVGLSSGSSFNLQRPTTANLSLTMAILDPGGDDPLFKLKTNAPGVVVLGS